MRLTEIIGPIQQITGETQRVGHEEAKEEAKIM